MRDMSDAPGEPSSRWSGRSRGGYWGNWFFIQMIRFLGVRWAYGWLVFVAAYYTVAAPQSRRCSIEFLERALGPLPWWKRPLLVFRHFYSFGVLMLDRMAVIMGRKTVQCRFEGEAPLKEALDRGKGIILLGAHLGSWEIGGQLLERLGKPVNLVVLEKEEARIRQLFDRALENRKFQLLATDGHPLRSIPILAALRRGEIVALHGDRSFGGKDLAVPFLGGVARMPVGPWHLAAASGAPVFQVFVVRERLGHYRFYSCEGRTLPRSLLRAEPSAFQECVSGYAARLEEAARQYPFQWCNFYPYWAAP